MVILTTKRFKSQIIIFYRELLRANITDPNTDRNDPDAMVFTSYPRNNTVYPIITVKHSNSSEPQRLGMSSEAKRVEMQFEVRVWARNEKEKEEMADEVYNILQRADLGSGGFVDSGIYNYQITNIVNVDEEGEQAIKSKVITTQVFAIIDTTAYPVTFPATLI